MRRAPARFLSLLGDGPLAVHVRGEQELGQPVGPRSRVLGAVELGPGGRVDEPVVGTEVEDERVSRQERRDLARGSVRQRQDDHVVACQVLCGRRFEDASGEAAEVRLVLTERRACVGVRSEGADLDLRVAAQEPESLAAGVSARTCYRYREDHVHNHTLRRKMMHLSR